MYVGPTKFRYSKWRPSWTWAESCSVFFLLFFGFRINIWIWLGSFRNLSWNNIKTWNYSKWLRQILPQHQSTYLRGPESVSIEILPFRPKFTLSKSSSKYMWVLWSKIYFIRNSFWKFYEVRSEKGDFNWCRFWAS